jgi:hypothetical protein
VTIFALYGAGPVVSSRRLAGAHPGSDGCGVIQDFFAKEKKGCTEYQHLLVLNTKGFL